MKRFATSLLFLWVALSAAIGAITEKYVSAAGAGAHDGSSAANAFSWAEMITDINAGGKAGNRYNYTGNVSRTTTTDTISGSGTTTSPIIIRGYTSTIGDGYQGRTGGNGLLVTSNMPVITYTTGRLNTSGSFIIFETLNITGAPNSLTLLLNSSMIARSCVVTQSGTGASAGILYLNTSCVASDCDLFYTGASGGAAYAVFSNNVGTMVVGCRVNVISATPAGIYAGSSALVINNVVYNCGGVGIAQVSTGFTGIIANNTVYGCAGDGIDNITGASNLQRIFGNMVTDNGGYGIDLNSATCAMVLGYNRTRDNTSGAINGGTDWVSATNWGAVTTDTGGASTDYVNVGSLDFNLIAASPATSASMPSYASMGAFQRSQTSSGGGQKSYVVP